METKEVKETKLCKYCQTEIPKKAKICPNCKKKQGGKLKWIAVAIVIIMLGSCISNSEDSANDFEYDLENAQYITEDELKTAYSNPDKYKGKYAVIKGRIFSTPEMDDNYVYFQMFNDVENSENNTIIRALKPDFELKDGDYVIVDGEIKGTYEYDNMFGGTMYALQLSAISVQKADYITVVSPTIDTIEVNQQQEQYGYFIEVEKIEFSPIETRVYVTVSNAGLSEFYFMGHSVKAIQNGTQYEQQYNYTAQYDEVQTEILSGVETKGIILFPVMDSNAPIELYFEGYSDNWEENIEQYIFNIEKVDNN